MSSLYVLFLKLLPKNLLSRIVGFLASKKISKIAIGWFARRYRINLDEAAQPLDSFQTLNSFFTRRLKDGQRPVAEAHNPQSLVSPVDGKIAQMGRIEAGRMIQAKGRDYDVTELLGDVSEAEPFKNGQFMTIYLAPTDYHRIHHYLDGHITGSRYIPGTLFPVNPFSVTHIENLFPINERLTTYFESQGHKTAIVKVGATIVGKIKVTYSDVESNVSRQVKAETFAEKVAVKKGDELGYFAMGSTVVLLFPENGFKFRESFPADMRLKVGELIGHWQK